MTYSLLREYQRIQGICYPKAERCSFYHVAGIARMFEEKWVTPENACDFIYF